MNQLFDFLSQYFWLVCIVVALFNFMVSDRFGTAEEDRGVDRVLRRKYLGRFWGLSVLPWLVVGYAQITGAVPSIWAYFRPQDRNPYVWTFYGAILFVYGVIAYWILFMDGARIAEDLSLLKSNARGKGGVVSAFWMKIIAIGLLPFFAFWMFLIWDMNVPVQ